LHFRNIRFSRSESLILLLLGLIIKPVWENIRSTGAEVAGMQNIMLESWDRDRTFETEAETTGFEAWDRDH